MPGDTPDQPKPEPSPAAEGSPASTPGGLPEGVPPPPPPKPNIVDTKNQGPTYGVGRQEGRKKKGKKGAVGSHPTDLLHASPPRSSRRGCCGCVVALLVVGALAVAALLAAVSWFGPGRYVAKEGYQIVNLDEAEAIVTEAPSEPTLYLGRTILYEAPQTRVPVAFFGVEVVLDGDFWEDASATATRVVGGATARFAKDLEIFAFEFEDEGIQLLGELRGSVMKNTP